MAFTLGNSMKADVPNTNSDGKDRGTEESDNRRPANRDWLRLRARSFSLRWAAVSGVLWLTLWSKGGYLLSGTPLIIAATLSSCAAVGFYVAHRTLNRQVV